MQQEYPPDRQTEELTIRKVIRKTCYDFKERPKKIGRCLGLREYRSVTPFQCYFASRSKYGWTSDISSLQIVRCPSKHAQNCRQRSESFLILYICAKRFALRETADSRESSAAIQPSRQSLQRLCRKMTQLRSTA